MADRRAVTVPFVSSRTADNPGAYRIQNDIAENRQQVGLLVDELRAETPLKQMPNAPMPSIEVLRILAIQPLHAARESLGARQLQYEMVVIGHQGVREDD